MSNNKKSHVGAETKQIGRFGIIGVLNTLIDFGVFNLFVWAFGLSFFTILGFPLSPANLISTTAAMAFSFVANKSFVFRASGRSSLRQAAIFLTVTAFSVYIIQNGVLYLFTRVWPESFNFWYNLLKPAIGNFITLEFATNNGAKAIAVGTGMVWNYFWYKKFVFKK